MGTLTGRFPDDIAAGAEGGHGHFKTLISSGAGGFEDRNQDWEDARGRWNIRRAAELADKHQVARSWFYKARGAFHDWRFKDWHDHTATRTGNDRGRLVAAPGGYQICKVYGADDAAFEYVRPLCRIVNGTVQIWAGGVLQAGYTVNNNTGIVSGLGGSGFELACEFDVLCRFEFDEFTVALVHKYKDDALFDWSRIQIVEVREVTPP